MDALRNILARALRQEALSDGEIRILLELRSQERRELLYKAARFARQQFFADKVFLYGFVYFSTYCRNDCTFCHYRLSNAECVRYRKTSEEVVEIAKSLADSGVHLLDLTMGEDPYYICAAEGTRRLVSLVEKVKIATALPLMISPGVVEPEVLLQLRQAGADWYACYQETHNKWLYAKLRLKQNYDQRWAVKVFAKTAGMLVEEGLLAGVGDTARDVVFSLRKMQQLGAEQVRIMTFVPQTGTPLATRKSIGSRRELNIIAVMRLLFPERLIPASLDVEGIEGLKARLLAGANVVTSLIPPDSGLAGVSQSTLDISDGYRTVAGVRPILNECGLTAASAAEYALWVNRQRGKVLQKGAVI